MNDVIISSECGRLKLHDTRFGPMLAFWDDLVIGRALDLYGEWALDEINFLISLLPREAAGIVVDIGANIGTHTLAFSRLRRNIDIVSIEPNLPIFSVLTANCLLNDLKNVTIIRCVAGSQDGRGYYIKNDDWLTNPGSVKSVELPSILGNFFPVRNFIRKFRLNNRIEDTNNSGIRERCPMRRIDSLLDPELPILIKIDVEGMEYNVIKGCEEIAKVGKAIFHFEQLDTVYSQEIVLFLAQYGYKSYWLETHPFNQSNFKSSRDNIWWSTEVSIVALPRDIQPTRRLRPVKADNISSIQRFENAQDGINVSCDNSQ